MDEVGQNVVLVRRLGLPIDSTCMATWQQGVLPDTTRTPHHFRPDDVDCPVL